MKHLLWRGLLMCASITILAAPAVGCRQDKPKMLDLDLSVPRMTRHEVQAIEAKGWKVERWISGTLGSVDVWIRITPLEQGVQKLPEVVKLELKLTHKDPKASRKASVTPKFEECSKMPKRYEYSRWGQEVGKEEEFPPKHLCWEAHIKDAFHSNRREDLNAVPLADGAYDLDVKVTLGIKDVPPFEFSPIRFKFSSKGPRDPNLEKY